MQDFGPSQIVDVIATPKQKARILGAPQSSADQAVALPLNFAMDAHFGSRSLIWRATARVASTIN